VKLEKRFSSGLQFLSHYTWSRAMSHESYYFAIDPKVGYGASYYNRPNSFVFAGNYDLPFGKGKNGRRQFVARNGLPDWRLRSEWHGNYSEWIALHARL